jgi:hypothetical protein
MDNPKAAEQIAGAFYDWLWAEFISSGEGRNKYLDAKDKNPEIAQKKFDDFRGRLSLPYDNDDNWAAHKDRGHQQQRVPMWVDTFEETSGGDPKADFYAAQAMFAPLMTASGSYRAQCYLEASSPADYLFRRSLTTSVDIEKAVIERIEERCGKEGFSEADISFSGLKRTFHVAYKLTENYFRRMSAWTDYDSDGFHSNPAAAESMKKSQINHIQLATDCVIMAAKLRRGELEAVPFLEPRSISDVSDNTYYPLRKRVNWVEVVAS